MSQLPLTISLAALPPNFEGGVNDYDATIPDRITISTQQSIALLVAGSTEPTSNEGLWFKDNNSLWYWSDDDGQYKPIILDTESQRWVLSATAPSQTDYDLWVVLDSNGQSIDLRTYYNGAWRSTIIGTANAVAVFNTTGEGLTSLAAGTTGQVLTSNGAGALPSFQTVDNNFIGQLIVMSGTTPPNSNYLRCDGSNQLRASYPLLDAYYAALAYPYGSGDGITTFTLPDDRGRTLVGEGTGTATDATAHTLGQEAGTETHVLTAAQIPAHDHSNGSYNKILKPDANGGNSIAGGSIDADASEPDIVNSASLVSIGGGGSHPNMQPYFVAAYFVRAK